MKPTRVRFPFAVIMSAAWLTGVLPSANCQSADDVPRIQINNAPITMTIEQLARRAGINYILDPKLFKDSNGNPVREPQVTLSWTNMAASNALVRLLDEHNLVMVRDKFTTVTLITGTNHVANVVDASLLGSTNAADQMTNGPIRLMQFDMAPLDAALKQLVEHGHINAAVDSKVSDYVDQTDPMKPMFHNAPTVSIRWENLSAQQAIVALCEAYNLVIVKDAATGVISIKPEK